MIHSKSKYPVGATWEGIENSKIAHIWLAEVSSYGYEIWRWSVQYDDGSGLKFDWATSYNACRKHIPFYGRMKKVK